MLGVSKESRGHRRARTEQGSDSEKGLLGLGW